MGYFSKVCAKSNLPVVHSNRGYNALNTVVALLPNGTKITGSYDGYGRVNGIELHEQWDKVKFVLLQHYAGESYDDLGKSGDEMAQGHFMSDDFLLYCTMVKSKGFKTYGGYKTAFRKYANW